VQRLVPSGVREAAGSRALRRTLDVRFAVNVADRVNPNTRNSAAQVVAHLLSQPPGFAAFRASSLARQG